MGKAYGASVCVSYARADEKRLAAVAKLYDAYQPTWINLKVDENVVQPRQSFKNFIEELGKADGIIVLLSGAYFDSFYCMLELTRILEAGNANDRVFPVFLDDFRLDNKKRKIKSSWEEKLKRWQKPYDDIECAEEYGSEEECKAIVDRYDEIFNSFAFDQTYNLDNLAKDNFKKTIEWSKERYLDVCKNNPVFEASINHLKGSSDDVKNALKERINDKSIAHSEENIIACLVQNHPEDLLNIIAKAQSSVDSLQSKQSLAGLLKRLLPLLFDPSYVPLFNAEREGTKIIRIPYATKVSAEVLMASSDQRELELYVGKKIRSDFYFSIPGKYHLGSPPEGGEATEKTLLEDTEKHLKSLTGDSTVPSVLLMENQLFEAFVNAEKESDQYSQVTIQRRIRKALEKIDAHYYWITPLNQDETWNDFAKELQTRYPKIIVLQLENNDEKEEEEADLFDSLHKLISY